MSSVQDKLNRVRKPRVHITYEVETEGATVEKELPFVVGVIGDFSAQPTTPLKPLSERKFIQVDRDNFDDVLARMTPGLNYKVNNTLANDGTEIGVNLSFQKFDDFSPAAVVSQVEPLRKLMEVRNQLRDLLSKADTSEKLEALLDRILSDESAIKALGEQVGLSADGQEKA